MTAGRARAGVPRTGTALVTGAASGIGRALAGALAARGQQVVLADLDGTGAAAAAAGLPGARGVELDVRDAAAVAALVDDIERAGPLELVVNNAGVAPRPGDGGLYELAEWSRLISVNLLGVVHGVNAAYPAMRARGRGAVLNVASLAGLVAGPGLGPYAATKHAVVGLSMTLRADAAVHGVRVSVLCPGWVDTPMLDVPGPDGVPTRDRLAQFRAGAPVPAAEVAAAALRGLDRDVPVIVTPAAATRLWRLQRAAPGLTGRLGARIARRSAAVPRAASPAPTPGGPA